MIILHKRKDRDTQMNTIKEKYTKWVVIADRQSYEKQWLIQKTMMEKIIVNGTHLSTESWILQELFQ
jgi:hypothetical protein